MKGQFWSIDGVFAVSIFTIAMLLLAAVWINVNRQLSLSAGLSIGNMQQQLISLESRLVSPGVPANWNSFLQINNAATWNGISIGLGSGNNGTISTAKALYLSAISKQSYTSYENTKFLLGTGYDYYIIISSPGIYNITAGRDPLANNATAIQVGVVAGVLDNSVPVSIKTEIWTNTSFGVS